MKKLQWHCGHQGCRSFCAQTGNVNLSNWLKEKIVIIIVVASLIAVSSWLAFRPSTTPPDTGGVITGPKTVRKHIEQGQVYYAGGKYDEALLQTQLGLAIDGDFPGLNSGMAASLLKLGRYDAAQEALEREFKLLNSLERKTDDELTEYVKIIEENDYAGRSAVKVLRDRLGLIKAAAHYNQACLYSLKKDRQMALYALERAIEAGFSERSALLDDDLAFIRTDPSFNKILQTLR